MITRPLLLLFTFLAVLSPAAAAAASAPTPGHGPYSQLVRTKPTPRPVYRGDICPIINGRLCGLHPYVP